MPCRSIRLGRRKTTPLRLRLVRARKGQKTIPDPERKPKLDQFAQLVTDFARQHEQHAATLQAQLQQPAEQVELLTEQYAHIAANYKTLAELLAQA